MVLSDGTIRKEIEQGRIVLDPFEEGLIQPSSVDVRVDRQFRVFHNARYPYIDVRQPMEELTELVTISDDEPFILHPGEFVLGQTLERVRLPDDIVARLEGKALALDTRVPTPAGWKTMAEIDVGDEVFGADGKPTRVVAATKVLTGRPCSELAFSDGTKIIADGSHQWEVQTEYDRRCGSARVLTTDEIAAQLWASNCRELRFHVRQAAAVEYSEKDLPVDPYVFGAWIGDGTSSAGVITSADHEVLNEINLAGYAVAATSAPYGHRIGGGGGAENRRDPRTGRFGADGSLQSTLRAMGVLGDKHIPRDYLEASVEQRRALLAGLMDTDGSIDTRGRCDLTTVKPRLAEQYRELIASLGHRPMIAAKPARLEGEDCGTRYQVTFTPSRLVFRLRRKRYRQEIGRRRHRSRGIAAVRAVPSVPVRCIEVAHPSGMFLVSESFVPTHNSSLGRLGLLIHSTAGFVDAGFEGNLTLELSNVANLPITIYHGMPIGQMSFMRMDAPVERPYGSRETGSKYQGQGEPTPSRFYLNFEK